jgi:hypothetical protein
VGLELARCSSKRPLQAVEPLAHRSHLRDQLLLEGTVALLDRLLSLGHEKRSNRCGRHREQGEPRDHETGREDLPGDGGWVSPTKPTVVINESAHQSPSQ